MLCKEEEEEEEEVVVVVGAAPCFRWRLSVIGGRCGVPKVMRILNALAKMQRPSWTMRRSESDVHAKPTRSTPLSPRES